MLHMSDLDFVVYKPHADYCKEILVGGENPGPPKLISS